jgi:hypothetical protein
MAIGQHKHDGHMDEAVKADLIHEGWIMALANVFAKEFDKILDYALDRGLLQVKEIKH